MQQWNHADRSTRRISKVLLVARVSARHTPGHLVARYVIFHRQSSAFASRKPPIVKISSYRSAVFPQNLLQTPPSKNHALTLSCIVSSASSHLSSSPCDSPSGDCFHSPSRIIFTQASSAIRYVCLAARDDGRSTAVIICASACAVLALAVLALVYRHHRHRLYLALRTQPAAP